MPSMESSSFFSLKLQHYNSELTFLKRVVQSYVKQHHTREKFHKEMQKVQRIIKMIKKHAKVSVCITQEQKLTDIELVEIFNSSFDYIDQRLRQIVYPVKLEKSDFELYMIKRHIKLNENTCGITMNIDTEKYDDRMVIQTNLAQIIDIQYHRFSIKSLLLKASEIMKSFKYHQVLHQNSLEVDVLLHQIVKNYNLVPYHNFTHAFSVFAMFYYFSKSNSLTKYMTDFQMYFSLVACLAHDLRHNGLNSIYETKVKSQMAMNFGNISTLEKMHKSVAFEILEGLCDNSPFATLTLQEKKQAKKIIINCILATDMAKHYDYLSHLKQQKLQLSKPDDRLYLMQTMIHACDIGNAMLDYDNYITWANLVCVQFHQQTIKQENEGLQITNHMRFQSLNYFYKNQASFINSIVLPIWQILGEQVGERKILEKVQVVKDNAKKVAEQMRRNSECTPKNNMATYLGNLLKQLKL